MEDNQLTNLSNGLYQVVNVKSGELIYIGTDETKARSFVLAPVKMGSE